ncbi:MAG: hypothetical protein AABZ47_12315 [Planctomycetota bacterium]
MQAVKQFFQWMVRDGRAPENPLAHLKGWNVRTDRRHDRRAMDADEVRVLIDVTRKGREVHGMRIPVERFGMTGVDRAMLYTLAVETGLRASELRTLTWADLVLGGDEPTVTIRAA